MTRFQPSRGLRLVSHALAVLALYGCKAHGESTPCREGAPYVHVLTEDHRLWLCDGQNARSYGVRLGMGGVGKQKEGDQKVPLGRYGLSKPRVSAKYGLFIPIGYPTPEQRARGFTGNSVGIHGPNRGLRWLGSFINTFDTTDGCIGIATDSEMAAIADWTRKKRPSAIVIEMRRIETQ